MWSGGLRLEGGKLRDPGQGRVGLETEGDGVRDVHVISLRTPPPQTK